MKTLFTLLFILSIFNLSAQRYKTEIFSDLDTTINLVYGTALDYQGNAQNLNSHIYQPKNDTASKRPLIIYIHGGGFASGTKDLASIVMLCTRMARKGYVVANIDYRLDPNFNLYNSTSDRRAMTDAMHDAKQAIRYFKANANTFKIDTNQVFIGGESAGAATAMMATYVDKQSEMASYPMANPNSPHGKNVNNQVSNKVAGVLCLCGVLLDTSAMESNDVPLLWVHSNKDNFIPIQLSFLIVQRAANLQIGIQTEVYDSAAHCPWYTGLPNWQLYLDSVESEITNFLFPLVAQNSMSQPSFKAPGFKVYPNPSSSKVTLTSKSKLFNEPFRILQSNGKVIEFGKIKEIKSFEIDLSSYSAGIYFLQIGETTLKLMKE